MALSYGRMTGFSRPYGTLYLPMRTAVAPPVNWELVGYCHKSLWDRQIVP